MVNYDHPPLLPKYVPINLHHRLDGQLLLKLSVELVPLPEFKEKLGDVWIVPGNVTLALSVDGDPTGTLIKSVPLKEPLVLRKSNSYKVSFSSRESPIRIPHEELNNWDQITMDVEIILVKHTLNIIEPVSIPHRSLSQDFRAMLALNEEESKKKFCDIKLTAAPTGQVEDGDTSTFYAHKAILATRSKVFAAMFSHDMLESADKAVVLPDIDSDVLQELLTYIYNGECPRIEELAESLIYHAEKYELDHLKALCEQQLSYDLQVDNAARILLLANTCNAEQLKKNALLYVNKHGDEVEHTKEWEDVQKCNDLLRDLVSTMYRSAKRQKLQ
jgi:speckle-type POZ protein